MHVNSWVVSGGHTQKYQTNWNFWQWWWCSICLRISNVNSLYSEGNMNVSAKLHVLFFGGSGDNILLKFSNSSRTALKYNFVVRLFCSSVFSPFFPPIKEFFSLIWFEDLRMPCCTDCKDHWGRFEIWKLYCINKIWFYLFQFYFLYSMNELWIMDSTPVST